MRARDFSSPAQRDRFRAQAQRTLPPTRFGLTRSHAKWLGIPRWTHGAAFDGASDILGVVRSSRDGLLGESLAARRVPGWRDSRWESFSRLAEELSGTLSHSGFAGVGLPREAPAHPSPAEYAGGRECPTSERLGTRFCTGNRSQDRHGILRFFGGDFFDPPCASVVWKH